MPPNGLADLVDEGSPGILMHAKAVILILTVTSRFWQALFCDCLESNDLWQILGVNGALESDIRLTASAGQQMPNSLRQPLSNERSSLLEFKEV